MNLPYPFKSAQDVKPDALGRIALVDEGGRVLAHLPLASAHGIAPKGYGHDGDGYGDGCHDGSGFGDGCYAGSGYGYGDGYGFGYGANYGGGDGDGSGKK
jgi:hypothetical protein